MSATFTQPEFDPHQFLREIFSKNERLYGDFRMDASGSGDGGDGGDGGDADKPDEEKTAEDWRAWSRKHEAQSKANLEKARKAQSEAKANADKAKAYDEYLAEKQTSEEKKAAAEAKEKSERESLRMENLRLKAASSNSISGADEEGVPYADLIAGSDEDSITRSAEAIARLVSAAKERDDLKKKVEDLESGRPRTGRPAPLRSGATPPPDPGSGSGSRGQTEAERRWGKPQAS